MDESGGPLEGGEVDVKEMRRFKVGMVEDRVPGKIEELVESGMEDEKRDLDSGHQEERREPNVFQPACCFARVGEMVAEVDQQDDHPAAVQPKGHFAGKKADLPMPAKIAV